MPEEGLLCGDRVWFYDGPKPRPAYGGIDTSRLGTSRALALAGREMHGHIPPSSQRRARAISTLVYGMAAALAASPPPSRAADLWLVPQETSSNGDGVLIGPMHEV